MVMELPSFGGSIIGDTNFTFKVFINQEEYSDSITYPLTFTEKNREESFNTAVVNLTRLEREVPFKPNKRVKLKIYADGVLYKTYPMLMVNDVSTQMGQSQLYYHKLNLVEYTSRFEKIVLPETAVTRLDGIYEPSLYDVAVIILNRASEFTNEEYTINETTQALLEDVSSPEFTFNRFTVLEALRIVFSMAKIIPTMTDFYELGHVGMFETDIELIQNYSRKDAAYDPETYNTTLFSNVENLVVGEDRTITDPGNGWMTPRSDSGFEISQDHGMFPTTRPIYKIFDVRLYHEIVWIKTEGMLGVTDFNYIPRNTFPEHWYKRNSIIENVYEKNRYDLLENTQEGKGSSLFYTQGQPGIHGLTHVPDSPGIWNPSRQAFREIIHNQTIGWGINNLKDIIVPEHLNEARTILEDMGYKEGTGPGNIIQGFMIRFTNFEGSTTNTNLLTREGEAGGPSPDLRSIRFQVDYTPLYNSDIYTFRERYIEEDDMRTSQFHNQQASVIDSRVLGEIHDKIIQRGSGMGKSITYLHRNHDSIIPLGARYDRFIFTSADYTYGKYGVKVIYNLDQYYTKLQKHVAVLEEHRQFSIPNEDIVSRQFTFTTFASFEEDAVDNGSGAFLDYSYFIGKPSDVEVNYGIIPMKNIALPAARYPFNNSLVFQIEMEGNVSAGSRSVEFDGNKRNNEPVPYTDENGRLTGDLAVIFGKDLQNLSLEQTQNLPYYNLNLQQDIIGKSFNMDKDAREQLKFVFQIHHIDRTGYVYINKWLAKQNGLVGGSGLTDNMGYVLLNKKPYEQDLISYDTDVKKMITANITQEGETVILPTITNDTPNAAKAHALVKYDAWSQKWRVLYWVDEEIPPNGSSKQLYINFTLGLVSYFKETEGSFKIYHDLVAITSPFYESQLLNKKIKTNHDITIKTGDFSETKFLDESINVSHDVIILTGPFFETELLENSFALVEDMVIKIGPFFEKEFDERFDITHDATIKTGQFHEEVFEDGFGINHDIVIKTGQFYETELNDNNFGFKHKTKRKFIFYPSYANSYLENKFSLSDDGVQAIYSQTKVYEKIIEDSISFGYTKKSLYGEFDVYNVVLDEGFAITHDKTAQQIFYPSYASNYKENSFEIDSSSSELHQKIKDYEKDLEYSFVFNKELTSIQIDYPSYLDSFIENSFNFDSLMNEEHIKLKNYTKNISEGFLFNHTNEENYIQLKNYVKEVLENFEFSITFQEIYGKFDVYFKDLDRSFKLESSIDGIYSQAKNYTKELEKEFNFDDSLHVNYNQAKIYNDVLSSSFDYLYNMSGLYGKFDVYNTVFQKTFKTSHEIDATISNAKNYDKALEESFNFNEEVFGDMDNSKNYKIDIEKTLIVDDIISANISHAKNYIKDIEKYFTLNHTIDQIYGKAKVYTEELEHNFGISHKISTIYGEFDIYSTIIKKGFKTNHTVEGNSVQAKKYDKVIENSFTINDTMGSDISIAKDYTTLFEEEFTFSDVIIGNRVKAQAYTTDFEEFFDFIYTMTTTYGQFDIYSTVKTSSFEFAHTLVGEIEKAAGYGKKLEDGFNFNDNVVGDKIDSVIYTGGAESDFNFNTNLQTIYGKFDVYSSILEGGIEFTNEIAGNRVKAQAYTREIEKSFSFNEVIEGNRVKAQAYTKEIEKSFSFNKNMEAYHSKSELYSSQELNNSFKFYDNVEGNIEGGTVYANFNTDGGTPESYTEQSGESPFYVTSPGTPTKSGYIFDGWSPTLPRYITQHTTFIAQWRTPVNEWVTFSTIPAVWDVIIDLGIVTSCPSAATAKNLLESQYPAASQAVGDRGVVRASTEGEEFGLPVIKSCFERRFRINEV